MKELSQYISEKLVLRKTSNNTMPVTPKSKRELINIIKSEVEKNGWECDLNHIDVSQITDMSYLFSYTINGYNLYKFTGDISEWDVSNVTDMSWMFCGSEFNGDISNWNVSNVEDMVRMFSGTKSFNQPIGDWDVRKVVYMYKMFYKAEQFNQDLSKWKIDDLCFFDDMFGYCPIKEEYKPKCLQNKI